MTARAHKTCIIVLGMHRSGTSALAGVLSLLGIHPGNTLLPAMEGVNPKGFWEHAEVVSIHDQLLEALDSSWYEEDLLPDQWLNFPATAAFRDRIVNVLRRDFDNQSVWLVKDPRICRLLPLWHEIILELGCRPSFIIVLRNPAEVAGSLRKRDDLPEVSSCLLWLIYMLEAEYRTRGQPRAFVQYERLLSDWRKTVANIGEAVGVSWPIAVTEAAPNVAAFLDSALRHHGNGALLPDHPACWLAQEGFELLSAPCPDYAKLDHLRTRVEELVSLVVPWSKQLHRNERLTRQNRAALARLEPENALLHAEIQRIKSSASWQITKPLRFAQSLVRAFFPDSPKT